MRVQHNITAMNSYRNFKSNNSTLSKNLEKLSSGYAINRAGDNAAGLAISEKMRAQITGLDVAQKNANDGISLVQTAEGALTEVHSMLNRMYELAEQSANGTYENSVDRKQLQKEVDALKEEINRIADSANFNGIQLLDGSLDYTAATTKVNSTFKFGSSDVQTGDPNYIAATSANPVLGSDTILHDGAVAAGKSQFSVDLNNYSVSAETNMTIKIGSGDPDGNAQFNIKISATEVEDGALSASDLASKLVDSIGSNTVSVEGHEYTVSADGNKLKFESVNDVAATAALDVAISVGDAITYDMNNAALSTPGTNAGAQVSFTFNSTLDGETLADEVAKWGGSAGAGTVAGSYTFSGVTIQVAQGLATYTYTNNTGSTINSNQTVPLENGTKSHNFVLTSSLANGSSVSMKYVEDVGYGSDDTVKITVNGDSAYRLGYTTGSGTTTVLSANAGLSAVEIGTTASTIKIDDGGKSVTIGVYATDGTTKIGDLKIDLTNIGVEDRDLDTAGNQSTALFTNRNQSYASSAGSVATDALNKVTDTLSVKVSYNPTVTPAGGGDYNVSTEVIQAGAVASTTRLASTYLSGANFDNKITDGSVLQIGGENYIFAVGSDSKVKDDGVSKIVDLTDKTAAQVLASGGVDIALDRLTKAAKGNEMFGVGYQAATRKLTLTENVDYYGDGSGKVLLNTKEKIQAQVKFGSVKQTETTTEASGKALTLQIGDTSDTFNQMEVEIADMHTTALGVKDDDGAITSSLADVDISTQEGAAAACDVLKAAINQVSDVRGGLGAIQNRLEHTINNLGVMQENLQNAESVIRDTDIADEMMKYTKNSILNQSAQAMLAQANQLPQGVLQLLQ